MSRGVASRSGPIGDDELDGLFAPLGQDPLALAVSGGVDSMALMHLVARWLNLRSQNARSVPLTSARTWIGGPGSPPHGWIAAMDGDITRLPPVLVLTVDHGLRANSGRDAALVREAAERLGIPCAVLRWEGEKPATGVQDAARTARRRLMIDLVATEPAAVEAACGARSPTRVLVMAHHLEDQAETVLMRLGRGSGLDGLKGMAANVAADDRSQVADVGNVRIVRPFLAISKRRLVETMTSVGGAWVDDPSNEDARFERVRIRKALETLADLGIGAGMIALSARRLADASEWIDHLACEQEGETTRFVRSVEWHGGVYAELLLPGTPTFDVPRYAAVRTLRQVLRSFGGDGRDPELQQLEALVEIIKSKYAALPDGMTLGGCRLVFVARDTGEKRLQVFREGEGGKSPQVLCAAAGSVGWDGGRFTVGAAREAAPHGVIKALGVQGWADLKRRVPALGTLRWPAAAAATLPVIEVGGVLAAYPGVTAAIGGSTRQNDDSGFAAPGGVKAVWAAAVGPEERHYTARFQRIPW